MDELLKNISLKDIEKLKMLMTIIPAKESRNIVTLRVFRDEYLNLINRNRSRSYYISTNLAFKHLLTAFDLQYPIDCLQLKEIEGFITNLQQKVKKGYVVYYRNLKAAFNKAKEWGYVTENYFTKIKLPKKQKTAPEYLDSCELLAISDKIKNKTVKDVVWFAFYTGMRLDEIVNLRWKNVDLIKNVITVGDENFITKGREQRFIPICEEVKEIVVRVKSEERRTKSENKKIVLLNKLGDPSPDFVGIGIQYVFCKETGEKYTGNHISRKFKCACIAAGANKSIHFHSLRHSFASNLAQKGVSLYIIKELLGHSSISTTEIYSHLNIDSLREAVEKLEVHGLEAKRETQEKMETGHFDKAQCRNRRLVTEKNSAKIFRINEEN